LVEAVVADLDRDRDVAEAVGAGAGAEDRRGGSAAAGIEGPAPGVAALDVEAAGGQLDVGVVVAVLGGEDPVAAAEGEAEGLLRAAVHGRGRRGRRRWR